MESDLNDLTHAQLKEVAKAYGLALRGNPGRPKLIDAIKAHEARLNADPVSEPVSDLPPIPVEAPTEAANDAENALEAPQGPREAVSVRESAVEAASARMDDDFADEPPAGMEPAAPLAAPVAHSGAIPATLVPDARKVARGKYPQAGGWLVYANGSSLRADCPCGHSHNAGQYGKCPGCGLAAPDEYNLTLL